MKAVQVARERNVSDYVNPIPPEQQAVRAKCFHPSGSFIEFKKAEIEQSIPDRFEQIVRKYPDRIAVKVGECALTYGQLNKAANRVARAILNKQGEGSEPLALLFDHGLQAITAIMGALKAGKFYVPLDPSFPQERIAAILEDCGARLVVTSRQNFSLARELTNGMSQLLDAETIDANVSDENLCLSFSPKDFAYILYTSGSTGQPKGVVQDHRGILHKAMTYTNNLHLCTSDRLTLLHPWSFGGCTHHLFGSLLNGASLFPFDARLGGGLRLAKWLITEQITIYHSVPTVFRQMTGSLTGEGEFPHLRAMVLGAAPVTRDDVELYKRHFSEQCILLHLMGSTESGGNDRHYFIDKASEIGSSTLPVGYAVEDKEVILLDDSGCKLGFGQVGEIAIKSAYLSPGYWRKPELTLAKFLPDPEGGDQKIYLTGDLGRTAPDGCLFHLGRKDFQVKVRGYRVEVSEIEMALLEHAAIKEVAVVSREVQSGDRRLVAYFVPIGQPVPTVSDLRSFLKRKLPDYMIPSAFVTLDALPLTPNGKVDRLALPEPRKSRPELGTPFVTPSTPVEEDLSRIWSEVLSLDQVGIRDNFFDLGGHSLAAARVVSQVIKQFQLELPLQSLFQSPTVAEMAVIITETQAKKLSEEDLTRVLAELESLSDEQAQEWVDREKAENVKDPGK